MIVREGFVSNSSSSSFVVAFPKKDITHDTLYNLLCPNHEVRYNMDENYHIVCSWWYNDGYIRKSDEDVVNRVYSDINSNLPATEDAVLGEIGNGFVWESYKAFPYPNLDNKIPDEEKHKIWDDLQTKREAYQLDKAKPEYQKLIDQAINQFGENNFQFYIFSYADDEEEGWLEHSDIFSNLPSRTFSHH